MAFYNESKFHMWRACIGTIWIDGKLDKAEEKWITEKIDTLEFTDEQRKILLEDLQTNINFKEVLAKITDKRDKAFLVHQMRVISHLDKDFSDHEKELLASWNKIVMGGLDLAALEVQIQEIERESKKDESNGIENKHSLLDRSVRHFKRRY